MTAFAELKDGEVLQQCGWADPPDFVGPDDLVQNNNEGCTYRKLAADIDWRARPSPDHRLMWAEEDPAPVWVAPPLDLAKSVKSAEITAAYLKANDTSFTFANKEIQADQHAMKQINMTSSGVIRRGTFVEGWSGWWKTLDNSYIPIPDVATWWAMCDAIETTGHANFNKAQQLKAAVAAATTIEEVAAIQWDQPAEAA